MTLDIWESGYKQLKAFWKYQIHLAILELTGWINMRPSILRSLMWRLSSWSIQPSRHGIRSRVELERSCQSKIQQLGIGVDQLEYLRVEMRWRDQMLWMTRGPCQVQGTFSQFQSNLKESLQTSLTRKE